MRMPARSSLSRFALAGLCVLHAGAQAQDAGAVTPYRPSVSSPAQLPLPGQLEFELGGLNTRQGDDHRASLPCTVKLAFSETWGVLVSGEALVAERQGGTARERGFGDTTVVLKRAFIVDSATAFGLEFDAKVPTARTAIGSGKADYGVNGIFSRDVASVHMDLNLNVTRLGAVGDGESRLQTGASAAFSIPVNARWGATAELAGTRRPGADSTAQLLVAASYSPSKQLVLDVGVARGLNHASPDWAVFSGLVMPLARLW